tara:strand:+ start:260 stop:544 length:285 start_codon:yes stop_codon:yes gene_type:complete
MAHEWYQSSLNQGLEENHNRMIFKALHFSKLLSLPDDIIGHIQLQIKLDELERRQKDYHLKMIRQLNTQSYYKQGLFKKQYTECIDYYISITDK